MLRRPLVIVLGLCTLGACTKKDEPAAAALSPEVKKKQECERFAKDMASTMLMTGNLLVTALDDDPVGASAQAGRNEMRAEALRLKDELTAKCLTWPEEVMRCLPPLGSLKDGCNERLIAAMEGATAPPSEVPKGPEPTWVFTLESQPRALRLADDGTVVVIAGVESNELVGLRDGAVAWRREGDHASWLSSLPGTTPTFVTAEQHEVVAFDPTTGTPRWTATLPDLPEDEGGGPSSVMVATVMGERLLVGDAEARFFAIDPSACAAKGSGCVSPEGRLADEYFDSSTRLFVDGNKRYLWEDETLRAFADDWRVLMTARAHDVLGHAAIREGRMVLVVDDDIVDLDPTQCRGERPIGVSGWPQPGAMVLGESECEDCGRTPPGCRRWRAYVEGSSGNTPALMDDGSVIVHGEEHTYAVHQGTSRWKIGLQGEGPLVTDGTAVFGVGNGMREDDPPVVFELDPATGLPRWQTLLPRDDEDDYVYGDDVRLSLAGPRLAVSHEQRVLLLARPAG